MLYKKFCIICNFIYSNNNKNDIFKILITYHKLNGGT